jgi:hypothetical protein
MNNPGLNQRVLRAIRARAVAAVAILSSVAAACSGTAAPTHAVAVPTVAISSQSTTRSAAPTPTTAAFKSETSVQFKPTLTIAEVPSAWSVEDDTPGTFIFDTGSEMTAKDGSKSAVYVLNHAMITPAGCANPVDTHQNATQMTATLVSLPGLVSSTPKAITIAGRRGFLIEVHVDPTWAKPGCVGTEPGVALLHSLPPTSDPSFDDGIGIGTFTAIYLLNRPEGGVMTIQIDDQSGGQALASYESIVETMQLQP